MEPNPDDSLFEPARGEHEPSPFIGGVASDDDGSIGFARFDTVTMRLHSIGKPDYPLHFFIMKRPLVDSGEVVWVCLRDFYYALGYSSGEALGDYILFASRYLASPLMESVL